LKVLLAHPGTQHAPQLAAQLARLGRLQGYWTGLAAVGGTARAALLRATGSLPGLRGLDTRLITGISPDQLHTLPTVELRALWKMRRGGDGLAVFHERNEAFQRAVPDSALQAADAVVGFDTSSWILAQRAAAAHKPFVLDRSIAHPAALEPLRRKLAQLYPAWAFEDAPRPDYLSTAEEEEHRRAARIVVGGSFAAKTLLERGVAPERVVVNTYGADWSRFATPAVVGAPGAKRPLRFLYVGSVIARKGVPVLLDAWQRLAPRDAELWLAGSIGPRERPLLPELPGVRYLGQVPRAEMPRLYGECDVFVLPSLFEGFGLVVLEALAAGLPVISSPHTGAVDVVRSPALGEIVPVLDAEALTAALRRALEQPPLRAAVQQAAAPLRTECSWEAYGQRWANLLDGLT
jgi:glycosyltransferase involved in cell wall biosynthesis